MRAVLIIIFSIVCFHSYGQSISHDTFLQQKGSIDSLTKQIDANRELVEERMSGGDSIYGQYNGRYVYNPQNKSIVKMECTFLWDPTSVNLFYFHNDSLVKISYKQTTLYCIGNILVNESGTEVKVSEGMNLWQFQNRARQLLKCLLED
jgi:hypothetical protein